MGTNSVVIGTYREYSRSSEANSGVAANTTPKPLKLVITTEITGYTCQNIYGERPIKNQVIVVPVYKMEVLVNNKNIAKYNVTRDAWYTRGCIESNIFSPDIHELSNRCFEPADANVNLYATAPMVYPPNTGLYAYALRQKGSPFLKAVAHTKAMSTYADDKPIHNVRANPAVAEGVMIHIGGWYDKRGNNTLAGSYGCFGIIPLAQIRETKAEAEKIRTSQGYKKFTPANDAYKAAIQFIINNTPKGTTPQVLIKQRTDVEQLRTIKNE